MVKLTTKRPVCFDLTHNEYCAKAMRCSCGLADVDDGSYDGKGVWRVVHKQKLMPRGLHLIPGVESEELHEAVLSIPLCKKYIEDGTIKAEAVKKVAKKKSAAKATGGKSEKGSKSKEK